MIGVLRAFIHGVLASPPACARCGSADVRPSHHPSPLAWLGLVRFRCRACSELFYLRSSQAPLAVEQAREYFDGGRSARPRRHALPAREAREAPPVDLDAVERDVSAALSRAGVRRDERS